MYKVHLELYTAVVDDLKKLADVMRQDLGDENYSMPGVNSRKPGSVKSIIN